MLPDTVEITLGLDDRDDEAALARAVGQKLGRPPADLPPLTLLKRSIDARRGRIAFHLLVGLGASEEGGGPPAELGLPHPREVGARRVVVVGDGPAGLFCAYELARHGIGTVVVDRGKEVQPRRRDLKLLNARGDVNEDSNYCFGEGGAGTYSDGKLYTRSHKRGPVRDVLEVLVRNGAPPHILTEARPHIGSNLLPKVIANLRERLIAVGVEFRFGQKLTGIRTEGSASERRVRAIELEAVDGGEKSDVAAEAVVLATGHSARDVFQIALDLDLVVEPKAFALGVRIEHPQPLIDRIQYGKFAGHPRLGAASYSVVQQVDGRGVFSFCMCPGGWIVPAMTDDAHLVVNGMSLSKRNSPYANSGLVVGVELSDLARVGLTGPLAAVELQARAEKRARQQGGGENRAPATRVTDFLARRASSTLPETSYLPGLTPCDVGESLDATGLPLADRIRSALGAFEHKLRGYVTEEAILVGVESRTSSPVRITRDDETLEARGLGGLYPVGEGAGYAGGIVSAAVDGLRAASAVAVRLGIAPRLGALSP